MRMVQVSSGKHPSKAAQLAACARLTAYEYEAAALAWMKVARPVEPGASRGVLVEQALAQAAGLREIADIIEGLGRLDPAMQMSLGIDVLSTEGERHARA